MPTIEWFWLSTAFLLRRLIRNEKKRASGPMRGGSSANVPIAPHFPRRAVLGRNTARHQLCHMAPVADAAHAARWHRPRNAWQNNQRDREAAFAAAALRDIMPMLQTRCLHCYTDEKSRWI